LIILQKLARKATRYGVRPEDIGPVSTFADELYMELYLKHTMGRWRAPSVYGVRPEDQERARGAWDKLIARVGPLKPRSQHKVSKSLINAGLEARRWRSNGNGAPLPGGTRDGNGDGNEYY
jgi:hypothetical protein